MGKLLVGNINPDTTPVADAIGDLIVDTVTAYLEANPPSGSSGEPLLAAHIVDPEPHPAYDDDMSLVTAFENGLA